MTEQWLRKDWQDNDSAYACRDDPSLRLNMGALLGLALSSILHCCTPFPHLFLLLSHIRALLSFHPFCTFWSAITVLRWFICWLGWVDINLTTLYSRCSSPALSCQLLKFLLFQRVFRLLGMVRRAQIIPTKASFSRLLMQKFLPLKNRIVFWHMILMNWQVGARKDSIVTEASMPHGKNILFYYYVPN